MLDCTKTELNHVCAAVMMHGVGSLCEIWEKTHIHVMATTAAPELPVYGVANFLSNYDAVVSLLTHLSLVERIKCGVSETHSSHPFLRMLIVITH